MSENDILRYISWIPTWYPKIVNSNLPNPINITTNYFNRAGTVTTPSISNIIYYYAYTTTSTGTITIPITDDGTGGGNAVFSDLSTCFISAIARYNTTSHTATPFVSVRNISGNNILLNVHTGNSGGILIGGTYTGMKDNSNTVTVYLTVVGE